MNILVQTAMAGYDVKLTPYDEKLIKLTLTEIETGKAVTSVFSFEGIAEEKFLALEISFMIKKIDRI